MTHPDRRKRAISESSSAPDRPAGGNCKAAAGLWRNSSIVLAPWRVANPTPCSTAMASDCIDPPPGAPIGDIEPPLWPMAR